MALFPLHFWMPNAYAYAPSIVSAFLAGTATKVAVYVFMRFFFTIFRAGLGFEELPLGMILIPLAIAGILVASTIAIFQDNIRRMLAYSSVAQIGYIFLGIGFMSATGLTGAVIHLFNHALMKGALFLAMACVVRQLHTVRLNDLSGIGRLMPVTMFAWVLAGLGMIGVPLTTGFVSKWYLVTASLESGNWAVAIMILLGSMLAVVYVWRVVEVAYFRKPSMAALKAREVPLSMMIPTCILALATVVFGTWATQTSKIARLAAEALLGTGISP
jgi:multicomponent Na+:H+ antiporter subunit D